MATRIVTTKTDDLDPSQEADQTVEFGLDEAAYEIDLTDANAERLRDTLAEFIKVARRAGGKPPKPGHVKRRFTRETARDIRVWVRANGGTVEDRGRIAEKYVDAFFANDTSIFRG
jgi:hypothetical protein